MIKTNQLSFITKNYFHSPHRSFLRTIMSYTPIKYINPELPNETRPGAQVDLPFGFGPLPSHYTNRKIFYFDIDNCLYNRSTKIHDMMQVKIHEYFKTNLNLDDNEAYKLHMDYYKNYGLALEGLVRNHKVDALKYNEEVDDSLDLKSVLTYNQPLRDMLINLKKTHDFDHFWLVTNAYKNHALRVISFLGLGDLFDGLTYCDYSQLPISCKPMKAFFDNCFKVTNVDSEHLKQVAFVDDSEINVKAAYKLGLGTVVHYIEGDSEYESVRSKEDFHEYYSDGKGDGKIRIIRSILDLSRVI